MERDARASVPKASYPGPLDTGITAALICLLLHLLVVLASGVVRGPNEFWPWLDVYRIRHPSESGWLNYLGYGLIAASAAGGVVGIADRAVRRAVGQHRLGNMVGWAFLLIAAAIGFFTPLLIHRANRFPVRPPSSWR